MAGYDPGFKNTHFILVRIIAPAKKDWIYLKNL